MTLDEKTNSYQALGVHAFIEHTIKDHQAQWGKMPHKIILGALEWKLLGLDFQDDFYIEGVILSCNQNIDTGVVAVVQS